MARNEMEIAATPEQVWDVLADASAYREWVVGAKEIRGADEGFPEKGTRFYHTIGVGPMTISDSTLVVLSERPKTLRLRANMGRLGAADITLRLEPTGAGTRVVMRERGASGLMQAIQPVNELLLRGRNLLSLDNLRELVERRG